MTQNDLKKYVELTIKDCKAARANPTAAIAHIDAIHARMKHVLDKLPIIEDDIIGAPV